MAPIYAFKSSVRRYATFAVGVLLAILLYNKLFGSDSGEQSSMSDLRSATKHLNEVEKPGNTGQVGVGTKNEQAEGSVNSNPNARAPVGQTVGGIGLKSPEKQSHGGLSDAQKLEKDCINFRKSVLKENNTKICLQKLSTEGLLQEITSTTGEWKRKHLDTLSRIIKENHEKLVCIEIGSGTGAVTLLGCMENRKSIASDPYLENLHVLQRALKLVKMGPRVKQLWYTVSNTSTLNVEIPWTPGLERKVTLDDITKHYMIPNEIVHLWVSHGGYELEVLQGGKTLFTNTQVCFAVVDFTQQRTRETGSEIIRFMKQYDFFPFEDLQRKRSLNAVSPSEFPSSVVFRSNGVPPCKIRDNV